MALFEFLQLLGIFFDYLGVMYLWHISYYAINKAEWYNYVRRPSSSTPYKEGWRG